MDREVSARMLLTVLVLVGCSGPAQTAAPTLTSAPAATATPTSPPSATAGAECGVVLEPAVAVPGRFAFAVGRGFVPGEYVKWETRSADGTLLGSFDTTSYESMLPDRRGGFGFGLGAAAATDVGKTFEATVTSQSCSAKTSWRVVSAAEHPLPTQPAPVACDSERSAVDRVDDTELRQIHAIYALPSDGLDRRLDVDGSIARSLEMAGDWSRERLGGSTFRLDTCDGRVDVSFVRLRDTATEYAARRNGFIQGLALELAELGFPEREKLLAVYWGGHAHWGRLEGTCGGEANSVGIAVLFLLDSTTFEDCPRPGAGQAAGQPEFGIVHEVIHELGFAAACAPHSDIGHVTDSNADVLYAGDDWAAAEIDAAHDDYYLHKIKDCPDLADSAFLDPLPANPVLPVDWTASD